MYVRCACTVTRCSIAHVLLLLQGTLAKKPYNPILGELFQCYYDVPEDVVPLSEVNEVEEVGKLALNAQDTHCKPLSSLHLMSRILSRKVPFLGQTIQVLLLSVNKYPITLPVRTENDRSCTVLLSLLLLCPL